MAEERHICALLRQGCGGCPLLETPYPEQLRQKQARVEALLGEFGPVSPILGMEHPWHYRNKAISTFCTGPGRRLDSGIYAAGTHRVVPVASCLLHHPALDEAVEAVRRAARLCRYEPYQEDRGTGLVRHVLVRHSRATGRVLVALVTAAPVLPGARAFVSKVRELCPQVETIVQNINPRRSSAVLGPREKVLWGRGYIEDTLCGVRFRLGASSFYQINPEQTEVLYRTALDGAGLDGTQTVVDAYCGVGTIGLAAAGRARRVLGVEFNPSAARCAAQNARANGAGNARFLCADATAYLQGMAARGERADVCSWTRPGPGAPRSSWVRWTGWGRSGSSTSPATRRRSGGISACWPDGGGRPGCSSRWISFPIRSMWSVWRCWPKSAEVVCEVRRLRSQNSMGAWRATCGARLPVYFVCYASFGGMAVATPLITTSPCWLVHTVSSLTIFFSGNSSRTVQVAVTVSPI